MVRGGPQALAGRLDEVLAGVGDPSVHVETARGTGPGGQHRKTRDTAVRAWHDDYPDIVVLRNSGRSQTINVDDALAELAERIAALHRSTALAAVKAQRRAQAVQLIWQHCVLRVIYLHVVKYLLVNQAAPVRGRWCESAA